MKRSLIIPYTLLVLFACQAQKVQLAPPLRIPIAPSGTFGEIRSNHYHGGIDLRIGAEEGIGTPVYAPADGHVSRLRISGYDGGKMLYIDHPGGITTVYLHLDSYHGAIADYVRQYQQEHPCYTFDTTLPAGTLPVHKGDVVAHAGNTGMSGGPHLHYEVRDTRTQQSLNPLNHGLSFPDTIPPTLRGIRLIPANDKCRIDNLQQPLQVNLAGHDTIRLQGRCYLAIYASDRSEGSTPNNGWERIDVWVDGRPFFQYRFTRLLPNDSRSLNAQLDYPHYLATHKPYITTRRLPGDPIRPARTYGDGSIGFVETDTMVHRITVAVSDYYGNRTVRCLYLKNCMTPLVPMHQVPRHISYNQRSDTLRWQQPIEVSYGNYQVEMPAGMVYADDLLVTGTLTDRRYISPILTVKPWESPFPPNHTYKIRMAAPVDFDPESMVICSLQQDRPKALPTRVVNRKVLGKEGLWLEADVRCFGQFVVMPDTTAPTVKPLNFADGKQFGNSPLRMRVSDNLSGIRSYRCHVNGEWVLAEFDGKDASLTLQLPPLDQLPSPASVLPVVADIDDSPAPNADNIALLLHVVLTDCCGNVREATYRIMK